MKKSRQLFILLVCLIAFSPNFFRALPWGMDSYFFLDAICNNSPLINQPIGAIMLFSLLPCNILLLNMLYFTLMCISCLFIARTGSLFNKEYGWLAGILVFATPIWVMEFWKIENDAIGFTILFIAAYFFYKGLKNNQTKDKLIGIGLVLLAQTFWEGAALWLIAFFLSWKWSWIASIPMFLATIHKIKIYESWFIGKIAPKFGTATELLPGFGLLYQGFLIPAIMYLKHIPTMLAPTTFFILLAFINSKFAIHATFSLAIAATSQFQHANTKMMKWIPVIGIIIVALFTTSMSQSLPPNTQELLAAGLAVEQAEGRTICNDWSIGHVVNYLGGKPMAKGGGEELCQGCTDCIMLTYREFDCQIINDVNSFSLDTDTGLKVYRC